MPRGKSSSGIYVAKTSFACDYEGHTVVQEGERVRSGHPLLRAYSDFFAPVDDDVKYDIVEQATAAPGEQRGHPVRAVADGTSV